MADEAFALSPISARAAQPSEADYDAIREAFMETSRGRWFLSEYAKRNRHSDTLVVLDAVARIEETLAAQKKPARDPLLDQALTALRNALGEAKGATEAALGHLSLEENLPPIRKGARVIREIAWRLREIGADGRICDLIDSQVVAIEGAAAKMALGDLADALSGAFDLIGARIASFDAEETEMSAPPSAEAAPLETADQAVPPTAGGKAEDAIAPASRAEDVAAEHVADAASDTEAEPVDAFTSDDEAMLDMVAMEMAAPDTDEAYAPPMDEMSEDETGERSALAPASVRAEPPPAPAPVAAEKESFSVDDIEISFPSDVREPPREPAVAPAATEAMQVASEAEPLIAKLAAATQIHATSEAEPAASLGSSLLANGIVQRPKTAKADPLAPIRRMSQNEKIAFFS